MDILFEIVFSLIFDSSIELIKNKKINNYIRYPLVIIISLFMLSIILFVGVFGVLLLFRNREVYDIFIGIILIFIDIILTLLLIRKIKIQYKKYRSKK